MAKMWGYFKNLLASGMTLSIPGAGLYITVTQRRRHHLIEDKFEFGNLLPPYGLVRGNIDYFERPHIENRLRHVFQPVFTNEYYLVCGVVGSGKTRSVVEVVRKMMEETKQKGGGGAPIYVVASQGKNFPDTLAHAVNFKFDEHMNFRYFLDCAFKVKSMPSMRDEEKLNRILASIEEEASRYVEEKGRPVVMVIDGVSWLSQTNPSAIVRLQQKAKLWADTNIVKMVFVTKLACMDEMCAQDPDGWSRAGNPVYIGDLTEAEAMKYLQTTELERRSPDTSEFPLPLQMSTDYARKVVDLVGGRIQDLKIFKRDFLNQIPFVDTEELIVSKERAKLTEVSKSRKAVEAIRELSKVNTMHCADFVDKYSEDVLTLLEKKGIVKNENMTGTCHCKSVVMFESKLTENVAKHFKVG